LVSNFALLNDWQEFEQLITLSIIYAHNLPLGDQLSYLQKLLKHKLLPALLIPWLRPLTASKEQLPQLLRFLSEKEFIDIEEVTTTVSR
jgi:hypothetical protein